MARRPLPMKPFHLYSIVDWKRAKRTGEYIYAIATTYAKTALSAVKTFKDNREGVFVVESEGVAKVFEFGGFEFEFLPL